MATDHRSIHRLSEKPGKSADTSLRAGSLQRAMGQTLPKTLTPYEWQQWYAEHGVPDSHINPEKKQTQPWWCWRGRQK